ncbi:MAG: hypothetical protein JST92_24370 [Deltaproteobacteria bacterium]|nr:hypothetical protein [Deltaproteobacteria bacterium]
MPTPRTSTAVTALAALACAACSPQPAQVSGKAGQARINFATQARRADTSGVALPDICGTFTLTPYQLVNGQHVAAGAPIVIDETHPGQTAFIAGCVDSTASGDDWSYSVSATGWALCDPNAALDPSLTSYLSAHGLTIEQFLATISPGTATTEIDFDCQAGKDVPADISVNVSVPLESSAGYVDISVSVNTTEVTVSCKDADFSDNPLHFGSSWLGQPGQTAPDAVWGISANAGTTHQFTGQVTNGVLDQFDTGTLSFDTPGSTTIVQTYAPACDGYYTATAVPQCTTTAVVRLPKKGTNTTASLADAYIASSADGWAAANVQAGQGSVSIAYATTFSPIPSGPANTSASPAIADTLHQQVFSDPNIAQFTGLWPALDQYGFVIAYLDQSGTPMWGHLIYDAASGGFILSGAHPLSGISTALEDCLGLFGHGQTGCQPAAQVGRSCKQIIGEVFPQVHVVHTRAVVKFDTALPIRVTDYVPTLSGALYLPDATGGLIKKGDLKFAPAADNAQVLSAALDCTGAIPGNARGFAHISMDALQGPADGPALIGDAPSKLMAIDCDNAPETLAVELAVPLAGKDASGNLVTQRLERSGARLNQVLPDVTCGADPADPSGPGLATFQGQAGLGDSFPGAGPSAYLVNNCYNDGGDEVPCASLETNDDPWIDQRVAGNPGFGHNSTFKLGRNRRVEFRILQSTAREDAAGASVRYDVLGSKTVLPANLDESCQGATTEAEKIGALTSGLNANGDRFAYTVNINAANSQAEIGFSAGALASAVGTPVTRNSSMRYALDLGRNDVLDTCIDPTTPDTVYLTTRNQPREPTDPVGLSLMAISVDLLGFNAPILDTGAGSDPAKLAAADNCRKSREDGSADQAIISFPRGTLPHSPITSPTPGPVEYWDCYTGDDESCVCIGGGIHAGWIGIGSVGGWFWNYGCKIGMTFPIAL